MLLLYGFSPELLVQSFSLVLLAGRKHIALPSLHQKGLLLIGPSDTKSHALTNKLLTFFVGCFLEDAVWGYSEKKL